MVVGLPPVPPLDLGRILGGYPGRGSNHAGVAPDKLQMVDSPVIRAQHHATGAKRGPLTRATWPFGSWVVDQDPSPFVNGTGLPMGTEIMPGQDADCRGYDLVSADTCRSPQFSSLTEAIALIKFWKISRAVTPCR